MHIGTMVEFAFALVGKLDVINKHSFNDFKLRVGELHINLCLKAKCCESKVFFSLPASCLIGLCATDHIGRMENMTCSKYNRIQQQGSLLSSVRHQNAANDWDEIWEHNNILNTGCELQILCRLVVAEILSYLLFSPTLLQCWYCRYSMSVYLISN